MASTDAVMVAEPALKTSGHYHVFIVLQHDSAADSKAASEAGNKQAGASMHATCHVVPATAGSGSCSPQEV